MFEPNFDQHICDCCEPLFTAQSTTIFVDAKICQNFFYFSPFSDHHFFVENLKIGVVRKTTTTPYAAKNLDLLVIHVFDGERWEDLTIVLTNPKEMEHFFIK